MQSLKLYDDTFFMWYGVATVSRIDKMIGFFCRISSLLYGSFAKETYNLIDTTNQTHPIGVNSMIESKSGHCIMWWKEMQSLNLNKDKIIMCRRMCFFFLKYIPWLHLHQGTSLSSGWSSHWLHLHQGTSLSSGWSSHWLHLHQGIIVNHRHGWMITSTWWCPDDYIYIRDYIYMMMPMIIPLITSTSWHQRESSSWMNDYTYIRALHYVVGVSWNTCIAMHIFHFTHRMVCNSYAYTSLYSYHVMQCPDVDVISSIGQSDRLNHRIFLQNIVSFIWLFCKRDL